MNVLVQPPSIPVEKGAYPPGTKIHPAADLFELIEGDEFDALVADVEIHGVLEPVWMFNDPELGECILDGRNRARAAFAAGKPIPTRLYIGDSPVAFVISENIRRRHLTPGQKGMIGLTALPLLEAEAAKRKAQEAAQAATERPRDAKGEFVQISAERRTSGEKKKKKRSADAAAKAVGTSGRVIARAKRVAEAAPDLAEDVRKGKIPIDRAERIVRDRKAEAERVAKAKEEAGKSEIPLLLDIRCGDFRDVLADLHNVDAIITDPPYPEEFLPLLGDLAHWADYVLAPDGVLAVLIGQTHLPEVYRLLGGFRPYRWTACYLTEGPGYVSHDRRVQSSWKPVLIYGGGPRFSDVIRSTGDDKARHKWGQNYDAFHQIIECLTSKHQTVVDPFMGSGTTLLAARALGRHAIGCDVDPAVVASAKERMQ